MRALLIAAVAAPAVLWSAAPASAEGYPPPFVSRTEWVQADGASSLRVYPTPSGRAAAGDVGTGAEAAQAWAEVLTRAPDADSPGMREQFLCHWQFAEFARPGKVSWNLEPWRPVVDAAAMLAAGCNPGGAEEQF